MSLVAFQLAQLTPNTFSIRIWDIGWIPLYLVQQCTLVLPPHTTLVRLPHTFGRVVALGCAQIGVVERCLADDTVGTMHTVTSTCLNQTRNPIEAFPLIVSDAVLGCMHDRVEGIAVLCCRSLQPVRIFFHHNTEVCHHYTF